METLDEQLLLFFILLFVNILTAWYNYKSQNYKTSIFSIIVSAVLLVDVIISIL